VSRQDGNSSTAPATVIEPKAHQLPLSLQNSGRRCAETPCVSVRESGDRPIGSSQVMRRASGQASGLHRSALVLGVNAFGHAGVHGKDPSMNSDFAIRNWPSPLQLPLSQRRVFAQDDLDETVVTATRTPVPLDAVGAPSSSSRAATSSDRSPATSANYCRLMPASRSRAMAARANYLAVHARHGKQPHRGAHRRRAHQPGTIGGAALQNIAPESLERIEIVKGHALRCTAPMPSAAWSSCSRAARRKTAQARARRSAAIPRSRYLATRAVGRRAIQVRVRRQLRRERGHADVR
jgi:hypothetical protein